MVKKVPGRRGGRPGIDPKDLKTVRFSLRLHPDLFAALTVLARKAGLPRSVAGQRILIAAVNADVGYDLLDAIGRRQDQDPPAKEVGTAYIRALRPKPPKR